MITYTPTEFDGIASEIVKFTGLDEVEVKQRLWMEAFYSGSNVVQDTLNFQVTPHHYDDKMEQLYRESYSFIFETLVFWVRPGRQEMTESALERLYLYGKQKGLEPSEVKILMLGDGSGTDSIHLAKHGFQVNYFDVPNSKTFDFAMKRFTDYGLLGKSINVITDYESCLSNQYDVIWSFEVLEHLPDPYKAINDISSMLKSNGIALISEDFWHCDYENLPTHLAINQQYDGLVPFMFLKYGMFLSWYNISLWKKYNWFKPLEFCKLERKSPLDMLLLLKATILTNYLNALKRNLKRNLKKFIKSSKAKSF